SPRRGLPPPGVRRRRPGGPGPAPPRAPPSAEPAMTALAEPRLPAIFGPIPPRPRGSENRLLILVGITILVGSVSLELAKRVTDPGESAGLSPANPTHLV